MSKRLFRLHKLFSILLCVSLGQAFAQEGKPRVFQPKFARDVLRAKPHLPPAIIPNGQVGPPVQNFSSTSKVSWRGHSRIDFQVISSSTFPKTFNFEIFTIAPALTAGSAGLTLTPINTPILSNDSLVLSKSVTIQPDGLFSIECASFAPIAPSGKVKSFGLVQGNGDGGAVKIDLTSQHCIERNGFRRYYAHLVDSSGKSSTNATIEYGELPAPEIPTNCQVLKSPEEQGSDINNVWASESTAWESGRTFTWNTNAAMVSTAYFQVSNKPFSHDSRLWRLDGNEGAIGRIPTKGNPNFGLELAYYSSQGYIAEAKAPLGAYYVRAIALTANGDLAALPSEAVTVNLIQEPKPVLPQCFFQICYNSDGVNAKPEFKQTPIWGTWAPDAKVGQPIYIRWAATLLATKASINVTSILSPTGSSYWTGMLDHQGIMIVPCETMYSLPGIYALTITPLDKNGKQVAESKSVSFAVSDPNQVLPPGPGLGNGQPSGPSFNFDINVVHFEPEKGEIPYHFLLSRDPQSGPLGIEKQLYANLTGNPNPHRGDKIYLPPKPDNGKSWSDYVTDGVNFVASVIKWAEGAIVSLNSYYDKVKMAAAEGISSATGIPASIVKMGIDIACEAMGVPENPVALPGLSDVGADFVAGEVLDQAGKTSAERDIMSSAIKSGVKAMANSASPLDDPKAPMIMPDPEFGHKMAIMTVEIVGNSSDPSAYKSYGLISVKVENWFEYPGTPGGGKQHMVLYEGSISCPKLKSGQKVRVPVVLRPPVFSDSGLNAKWQTAMQFGDCTVTVDGKKYEHKPCIKAWS